MEPKVSVITGYFNRSRFLRRTIESIISQTFSDWELIIFDDCSTDNTRTELKRLLEEFADPRIRVRYHDKNIGFVNGMRLAVESSRGEYIAVQGSGDVSLPRRLELQASKLASNQSIGAVVGPYYYLSEDGATRHLKFQDPTSLDYAGIWKGIDFTHGEVMYRRAVYDHVGGYRCEFTFAQDFDLWLRMAKVTSFTALEEPIYERYGLSDGASYDAKKFVEQRLLSEAARRLSEMSPAEEERSLERIRTKGVASVIPVSDPEIQRRLRRGAIRMITLGAPMGARDVAKSYIDSFVWRLVVSGIVTLHAKTWFAPAYRAFNRIFNAISARKRGSS